MEEIITKEQLIALYKECKAGNTDMLCIIDNIRERLYEKVAFDEGIAEALEITSTLLPIAKFLKGIYNMIPTDIEL